MPRLADRTRDPELTARLQRSSRLVRGALALVPWALAIVRLVG